MISFNCKELQIFRQSSLAYDCSSKGQCPPPLDQWCIWQSRNLFFRCSFYSYAVNEYEKVLSRWEVMKLCWEPCSLCFFLLKNSLTSTGMQSWTFLSQGMTRFRILTTRRLSMFLLRIPLQAHLTLIRWTLCGTIVSTKSFRSNYSLKRVL